MNSLGLVLYDQGKYNKAEIEFIESHELKKGYLVGMIYQWQVYNKF